MSRGVWGRLRRVVLRGRRIVDSNGDAEVARARFEQVEPELAGQDVWARRHAWRALESRVDQALDGVLGVPEPALARRWAGLFAARVRRTLDVQGAPRERVARDEVMARLGVAWCAAQLPPDDETQLVMAGALGGLLISQHRDAEAVTLLEGALDQVPSASALWTCRTQALAAMAQAGTGDLEVARARLADVLATLSRLPAGQADAVVAWEVAFDDATVVLQSDPVAAAALLEDLQARAQSLPALGSDHVRTLAAGHALGLARLMGGDAAGAEALLRQVGQRLSDHPDLGPDHGLTWRAVRHHGVALSRLGRLEEAWQALSRVADGRARVLAADDPLVQESREDVAELEALMAQPPAPPAVIAPPPPGVAAPYLVVWDLAERTLLRPIPPPPPDGRPDWLSWYELGRDHAHAGRMRQGSQMMEGLADALREAGEAATRSPLALAVAHARVRMWLAEDEQPEALRWLRWLTENLAAGHAGADLGDAWHDGALLHLDVGDTEAALAALDAAGSCPRTPAAALSDVRLRASVWRVRGDLAAAAKVLHEALQRLDGVQGDLAVEAACCTHELALIRRAQGDPDAARAGLDRAVAQLRELVPPHHPVLWVVANNQAAVLASCGELDAADQVLRPAHAELKRMYGVRHIIPLVADANLGRLLMDQGREVEAGGILGQVAEAMSATLGVDHPAYRVVRRNLSQGQGVRAVAGCLSFTQLVGFLLLSLVMTAALIYVRLQL